VGLDSNVNIGMSNMASPKEANMDMPVVAPREQRTRRAFLAASLGGLGAWVASALTGRAPVQAADNDPVLVGSDLSGGHTTKITNTTAGFAAIWGNSSAATMAGVGVRGDAATANANGAGVWGNATGGAIGVRGNATSSGIGVSGEAGSGIGVSGRSSSAAGVQGSSASSSGVLGVGVVGVAGTSFPSGGIGGVFDGATAQFKLVPKPTQGKPTSGTHQKGEIYMDSKASLFICTANGTPGTWKKVTAKLV
jgi:hypothetical protein